MGVDVVVVLDHSLSRERLLQLDDVIGADSHGSDRSGPGDLVGFKWALDVPFVSPGEQLQAIGHVDFDAPDCLGTVYDSAIEFGFVARWSEFLSDDGVQDRIRGVVRRLAAVLGSEVAVYLPDSAFSASGALELLRDNASLADVEAWLSDHVGDAAPSPRDIYSETEDTWDGDGYFVERHAR